MVPFIAKILALCVCCAVQHALGSNLAANGSTEDAQLKAIQGYKRYLEALPTPSAGQPTPAAARRGLGVHYHYHYHEAAKPAQRDCKCPKCPDPDSDCPKWPDNSVGLGSTLVVGSPVHMDDLTLYMVLPENDEHVSAWIRGYKRPHDEPILRRLLKYIRPGSTVLDLGANLGTYTIFFSHRVGPSGRVWAFEAQEFVSQVAITNTVINGLRNVRLLNVAVGFKQGVAHMGARLPDGVSANKTFQEAQQGNQRVNYGGRRLGEGGETVPMITVDSLGLDNISLIKMDIQGAEPLAVYGAQETIKRSLPVVNFELSHGFQVTQEMISAMEIPPEVVQFDMVRWLSSIGYTMAEAYQEDQWWVPPGYQKPANISVFFENS